MRVDLQYFIFLFGSRPLQIFALLPGPVLLMNVFLGECPFRRGLRLCLIIFSNLVGLPPCNSDLFICVFFLPFLVLFWRRTVCLIHLCKTPALDSVGFSVFPGRSVAFIFVPLIFFGCTVFCCPFPGLQSGQLGFLTFNPISCCSEGRGGATSPPGNEPLCPTGFDKGHFCFH